MKIKVPDGDLRWSLGFIDARPYNNDYKFPAITFAGSTYGNTWFVSKMCDVKYSILYPSSYTTTEVEAILAKHPEGTAATRLGKVGSDEVEIKSYGGKEVFRYYPNGITWQDMQDTARGQIAVSEEDAIQYLFNHYKHGGQAMEITGAFYMVYSPSGSTPPKVRYLTADAAIAAAELGAKTSPGQQFYVLQALSVSQSQPVVSTEQLK